MRTVFAAALAAALLAGGAPAMAQYGMAHPAAYSLEQRENWLQERINRGRRDGSLDGREAMRVEARLNEIRGDQRTIMARNGRLAPGQVAELEGRLDRLNTSIVWLRHNAERRPW